MHLSNQVLKSTVYARHIHKSETMTNSTHKSPFGVLLLVFATLLAVVGHHAASGQGGNMQTCFINCRLRVISCATGCRIGAGPFRWAIRYCIGQCGFQNFQCLQSCTNPSPQRRSPPPRRPILPPIFHRPPHSPILPPIFHRPPHSPILPPILPPIFHRPPSNPPRSPILPNIPPVTPILPKAPKLSSSLIYRPPPFPSTTSTQDPLPSSSKSSSISAFTLPLPPSQVDHFGKGN